MNRTAIVIGAGIVGLATAKALSEKGFSVTVVERGSFASGASVRNFGMIWPVGQPEGPMYNRAFRSRNIWKEVAEHAGIWHHECGSLHLAYHDDEWTVLQELYSAFKQQKRSVSLLHPAEIVNTYHGVNPKGLLGGLFSETELIVDPREAIAKLPAYLSEKYAATFIWDTAATQVNSHTVKAGDALLHADIICICSGADFETLYPAEFAALQITKCKLQMLRFANDDNNFKIGTSLCGGLSLIHYESFKAAPSLLLLKDRYKNDMGEYLENGIHVMVSQNGKGELTVGDSHEYGLTFAPFDNAYINHLITTYLATFALTRNWKLIQSWHGIYPKMTNGATDIFLQPEPGVYIINGLGGAGMTLSFGYTEEVIKTI